MRAVSPQRLRARRSPALSSRSSLAPLEPFQRANRRSAWLKATLCTGDITAITLAWASAFALATPHASLAVAAQVRLAIFVVAVTFALVLVARLHLLRTSWVRSVESARLLNAAVGGAVVGYVSLAILLGGLPPAWPMVLGGAVAFLLLQTHRSVFRAVVTRARRNHRLMHPVVVVGTFDDAAALAQLLREQPELGYTVAALAGPGPAAEGVAGPDGDLWRGGVAEVPALVRTTGATGAIIAGGGIPSRQLDALVQHLHAEGAHVVISTGLTAVDYSRLRPQPLAHQPLMYVEAAPLLRWAPAKRALDVGVATLALVILAPLLAVVALAIRWDDGRPVLYRQQRVGLGGAPFEILKFRSMRTDADARRAALKAAGNDRADGSWWKLADEHDPRITRVGRILRASSIDELPQLITVLKGDMSIVGPRPPMADEAEGFDEQDFRARFSVKPGITGLWQVEARDNLAFGPYRRLDLFYVNNWSLALDVTVMFRTIGAVLGRGLTEALGAVAGRFRRQGPESDVEVSDVAKRAQR